MIVRVFLIWHGPRKFGNVLYLDRRRFLLPRQTSLLHILAKSSFVSGDPFPFAPRGEVGFLVEGQYVDGAVDDDVELVVALVVVGHPLLCMKYIFVDLVRSVIR
jgi:hypothetical protein